MQLKLLPSMAKNAHGINYELELDMHVGKVDAAVYLSNHLRKHTRPALSNFRKNRIERLNVALDEASQLEQEAQKSGEVASVELQGVQGMEMKIRKVDDTLRREKETCEAISKQHTATTEDVELRIASILNEADLSAEELQSRQLLEEAQNRYDCSSLLPQLASYHFDTVLAPCVNRMITWWRGVVMASPML